jgi:ABC-type multidrug transport system ATPase subunit
MKQRLKYALALIRHPDVWLFDEPTANLDEAGKNIAREIIYAARTRAIVILATNEKEEGDLAENRYQLGR